MRSTDRRPDRGLTGRVEGCARRYTYESEVEEEIAIVFLEDAIVKTNTVRWPEVRKAIPEDYVVSILDSLERIPPAR